MIGNTRKISEDNDGEELEHPIVRRRANSSDPQGKLVNVPTGLEFILILVAQVCCCPWNQLRNFGASWGIIQTLACSPLRSAEMPVESLQCCR